MNIKSTRLVAALAVVCIILAGGCASPTDDSSSRQSVRNSDTDLPPTSPISPSSPTAGPANADPHGFTQ